MSTIALINFNSMIILLILLIKYTSLLRLNKQNPTIIKKPYISHPLELIINFTFDEKSKGMTKNQSFIFYFYEFYNSFKEVFDNDVLNKDLLCSITNSKGITYLTTANYINSNRISGSNHKNPYVICTLIDNIRLITNDEYTLSIKFKSTFQFNKIKGGRLLLVNSNTFDISKDVDTYNIIEDIINIGPIYLMPDYINTYSLSKMDVSFNFIPVDDSLCADEKQNCYDIYLYDKLNIEIPIISNTYYKINDYDIYITIPENLLDTSNVRIQSTDYRQNASGNMLISQLKSRKEGLELVKIRENFYKINNINEDITIHRKFKLVLSGLVARKVNTKTDFNKISLSIYRSNSYVIDYYKEGSISISRITMSSSDLYGIYNPDNEFIFQNSAWPVVFTFVLNSPIKPINKKAYMSIEHYNYIDKQNSFNFLSSTCDFSLSSSSSVSKKTICYSYKAKNGSSGIVFNLGGETLLANKVYSLLVWGQADYCSNSNSKSFLSNAYKNRESFVNFEFVYKVYTEIAYDLDDLNVEGSFIFDDKNLISSSNVIQMSNKCYSSIVYEKNRRFLFDSQDPIYKYSKEEKISYIFYREFYNFRLLDTVSLNCESKNCQVLDDVSEMNKKEQYKSAYFYTSSSSNRLSNESNFLIEINLNTKNIKTDYDYYIDTNSNEDKQYTHEENDFKYIEVLPLPYYIDKNNDEFSMIDGNLNFFFAQNVFTSNKSLNSCFFSWANNGKHQKSLLKKEKNNQVSYLESEYTFDLDKTKLFYNENYNVFNYDFNQPPRRLSISSTKIKDQKFISNKEIDFFKEDSTSNSIDTISKNDIYIYFYSNCITYSPIIFNNTFKSIFYYFEFTYQYQSETDIDNLYAPTQTARFIKLYPEIGVFHREDLGFTYDDNPRFVNSLYTISISSLSICLLQIKEMSLIEISKSSSNTLVIWLLGPSLFTTDWESDSNSYPISGIYDSNSTQTTEIKAYSSKYPFSIVYQHNIINNSTERKSLFEENYFSEETVSSYIQYLGSMIVINKKDERIINTNTNDYIYIPMYCPPYQNYIEEERKLNDNEKKMRDMRNINGLILTIQSYDNETNTKTLLKLNGVFMNTTESLNKTYFYIKGLNYPTFIMTKVQWNSNEDRNINLYINYNKTSSSSSTSSLPQVLFINKQYDFLLQEENTFQSNDNKQLDSIIQSYMSGNSKKFYIKNKEFSHFLIFTSVLSSKIVLKNINKPLFYDDQSNSLSSQMNKFLYVGYENEKTVISNYIDSKSYDSFGNMVVDFISSSSLSSSSSSSSSSSNKIMIYDIEVNMSIDTKNIVIPLFNSFKYEIPIQSPINIGSTLSFQSNQISNYSICGIESRTKFIDECLVSSEKRKISCKFNENILSYGNKINICCFNLINIMTDKGLLTNLQFSLFKSNNFNDIQNSIVYSDIAPLYKYQNPKSEANKNYNDPIKIEKIEYFHVNQENGYGNMKVIVLLTKSPVRGSIVEISINLSTLSTNLNCKAFFSSEDNRFNLVSIDSGDFMIDYCEIEKSQSGSQSSSSSEYIIKIRFNNKAYKCESAFLPNLVIDIYPIVVIDYNTDTLKKYNIKWYINNDTSKKISVDVSQSFTFNLNIDKTNILVQNKDNLCEFNIIGPMIDGGKGVLSVSFLLSEVVNSLSVKEQNSFINEVSLFLNEKQFGFSNDQVECFDETYLYILCEWSNGILNIYYSNPIDLRLKKDRITVYLNNILFKSSYIQSLSFVLCTLNYKNKNSRKAIVTGQGYFKDFNFYTSPPENLWINQVPSLISKGNAYDETTVYIRIMIESDLIDLPITCSQSTYIFINIPVEYSFLRTSTLEIKASIYEVDIYGVINLTKTISLINIIRVGNSVKANFENGFTIDYSLRYIDISISKLILPVDSSSRWEVFIYGSTCLFQTYSNVDIFKGEGESNSSFDMIRYSKGYKYFLNKEKIYYRLELVNSNYSDNTNNTSKSRLIYNIKQGRFNKFRLILLENTSDLSFNQKNYKTEIVLNEKSVAIIQNQSILLSSNELYTDKNTSVQYKEFYLGVPCLTQKGYYFIDFLSKNKVFIDLKGVILYIDFQSDESIIDIINNNIDYNSLVTDEQKVTIRKNSILNLYYKFPEPPVDDTKIDWESEDVMNSDKIIIKSQVIKTGSNINLFQVYSNDALFKGEVSLIPKSKNQCYIFKISKLKFKFEGELSPFQPNQVNIEKIINLISFQTKDKDFKYKSTSIEILVLPPVIPLYLFCTISCRNDEFISDYEYFDVYNNQLIENNKKNHLFYYLSIQKTYNITNFNYFLRGVDYKLKCDLTSTEVNLNERKNITFLNKNLSFPDVFNRICVGFQFQSQFSEYDGILDYLLTTCQSEFKNSHSEKCLICKSIIEEYELGYEINPPSPCKNTSLLSNVTMQSYYLNSYDKDRISSNNSFIKPICIYQQNTCRVFIEDSERNSVFSSVNKIINTINDYSNSKLKSFPNAILYSSIINDSQDILLNVDDFKLDKTPDSQWYNFTLSYNSFLLCYLSQIVYSSTEVISPPSYENIVKCQSNSDSNRMLNCRQYMLSPMNTTVIFENTFDMTGQSVVWTFCEYLVPLSMKRSKIFNIFQPPVNVLGNNKNESGNSTENNGNGGVSNSTSGGLYVSFTIYMILVFVGFAVNVI